MKPKEASLPELYKKRESESVSLGGTSGVFQSNKLLKEWPTSKWGEVARRYFRGKHNIVQCPADPIYKDIFLASQISSSFPTALETIPF